MITDKQFSRLAQIFNIEVAAIKAVASVESSGSGFLPDGKPVILFEPHIFWRELKKVGKFPKDYFVDIVDKKALNGKKKVVNPLYADILYEEWGKVPYGKSSQQHARLERAKNIDKESAIKSASWGMFQIMGFNWQLTGSKTLDDFVLRIQSGEDAHLEMFLTFVRNRGLLDELQKKQWAAFAEGYNGKGYKKNKYDTKMEAAYIQYSKKS